MNLRQRLVLAWWALRGEITPRLDEDKVDGEAFRLTDEQLREARASFDVAAQDLRVSQLREADGWRKADALARELEALRAKCAAAGVEMETIIQIHAVEAAPTAGAVAALIDGLKGVVYRVRDAGAPGWTAEQDALAKATLAGVRPLEALPSPVAGVGQYRGEARSWGVRPKAEAPAYAHDPGSAPCGLCGQTPPAVAP